ncbi:MAG: UPF0104 family protein [Myxococcales bacterium]|nr:MAG: UPF0104 family protein [Myxococcales bacterium]
MIRSPLARRLLTLAVSAGLLGALVYAVQPARLWASLLAVDLPLFLLGGVCTPLVLLAKIFRWRLLARQIEPISLRDAAASYMHGLVLATITPFAAGEAARAMFLKPGNRARLTGKVIVDKLIDLSTVGVLAGLGMFAYPAWRLEWLGLVLVAGAPSGWLLLAFIGRTRLVRAEGRQGALAKAALVVDGLASTSPLLLFKSFALSLAGFAFYYLQSLLLLRAFAPGAPVLAVAAFPAITLSTILPIAFSGVGVREGTAVLLLAPFGVDEAAAFNAAFLQFVVVQVVPVMLWAIRRRPRLNVE